LSKLSCNLGKQKVKLIEICSLLKEVTESSTVIEDSVAKWE